MIERFFNNLISGDIRSFVVLIFIALIVYALYKFFQEIYKQFKPFFRVLFLICGGILVYGLCFFPEDISTFFSEAVDAVTQFLEPILK